MRVCGRVTCRRESDHGGDQDRQASSLVSLKLKSTKKRIGDVKRQDHINDIIIPSFWELFLSFENVFQILEAFLSILSPRKIRTQENILISSYLGRTKLFVVLDLSKRLSDRNGKTISNFFWEFYDLVAKFFGYSMNHLDCLDLGLYGSIPSSGKI